MKYRPNGSAYIRGECDIKGCNHLQRYRGLDHKGNRLYGKVCTKHHKIRYNMNFPVNMSNRISLKYKMPNDRCIRCEWEGPCDRHRMIPSEGYVPENVRILCPNCHRLVTLKLIIIE